VLQRYFFKKNEVSEARKERKKNYLGSASSPTPAVAVVAGSVEVGGRRGTVLQVLNN
jgi:hypothetical protein